MSPDAVSQHDQDALLRKLREMEARSRSLERQLKASDRLAAVGALAAGLAHEFNNLLTPMSGIARLALDDPADAPLARKALHAALAAADRGSSLAGSILSLAGDALAGPPAPSDCIANVAAAIEGALACVARDPAREGVALRIDAPSTLAVAIPAPALRQVLLNLILNALQAMRRSEGGALAIIAERSTWNARDGRQPSSPKQSDQHSPSTTDNIASRPSPPVDSFVSDPHSEATPLPASPPSCGAGGASEEQLRPFAGAFHRAQQGVVRITVADTGPGVPSDLLPSIFEPFVSTRDQELQDNCAPSCDEPSKSGRCAGLGLAICQRLIRAADGDISAHNDHPAGARFIITLPEA